MTPQQRLKIGAAEPWLPPSAFDEGLWERALVPTVEAWSMAWFGTKLIVTAPMRAWSGQAADWKACGEGVALGCAADQRVALAGKLLGFKNTDSAKFNTADVKLAEELAWRCATALGDAIAIAVDLGRKPAWQRTTDADLSGVLCAGIGPRVGETWLRFAIDRALLVQLIRQAAPDQRALPPLSRINASIEEQAVSLSALVGRCQATLGDLSSLVPGDVLCLDTSTDAPVALAIEHVASTATCHIEQDGGALRLRISR